MKRILALLPLVALLGCSLLRSPPASASTITVTWVNPTTNTDNSTITDTGAESLQSWRIEFGSCGANNTFGTKAGEFVRTRTIGGAPITTATNNVPAGQTCVRVSVSNQGAKESAPSNVAVTVVEPSTPRAPANVIAASG